MFNEFQKFKSCCDICQKISDACKKILLDIHYHITDYTKEEES